MKPAKVYFTSMRTKPGKNMLEKLDALLKKASIEKIDFQNKLTAIKIHFGEPGNLSYIRPNYAARVVQHIQALGGKPFLTDCNTLYHGRRANAVDHLQAAMENGFNRIAVNCDVVIADGLVGADAREIPINLKHVAAAKIGTAIADADVLISLNHFKGHEMTGFGGALKNIGMGSGSRKGKLEMHSASKPKMVEDNCVACGICIKNCPQKAIAFNANHKAQINYDLCIGCGQCVAVCHYDAAQVVWDASADLASLRIAEYAYAVLLGKPHFHVNFIMDISPNCDCWNGNDQAIAPSIGIAASFDPVALDRASVDLVNQAPALENSHLTDLNYKAGDDKFTTLFPKTRWQTCLEHAEEIGLGTQNYQLITVK